MPPSVTSTFRSGSTGPAELGARSARRSRRAGRARRASARTPAAQPRCAAASTTCGGMSTAGCPPVASRFAWLSPNARDGIQAALAQPQQPPEQREVDVGRAHELGDLDVLDVGVRARADGAVVDGRDAGRGEDGGVGDDLLADRLELAAGHLGVGLAQRARERVVEVDLVRAAHEPQVEVDRAAGLGGDRLEQRAELRVDRVERVAGRPAARADDAALGGPAVVEVAAVHLADEVRLGADPRVLVRAPARRGAATSRRRPSPPRAAGAASRAASAARASACPAA